MGWYLRKGIKIAPGIRLNLSGSGIGISGGIPGARVSLTPNQVRIYGGSGPFRYQKHISTRRRATEPGNTSQSSFGFLGWLGAGILVILLWGDPLYLVFGLFAVTAIATAVYFSSSRRGKRLFEEAVSALEENPKSEDAFGRLLQAKQYVPDSLEIDLALAIARYDREEIQEAISVLEELRASLEDNGEYHFFLGTCYQESRQFESAIREYQKVDEAEEYDEFMMSLLKKARCFSELSRHDSAIEALKTGLRRRKQEYKEVQRKMRYLLGNIYESNGDKAKAKREYERIVSEDIDFPGVSERLENL